MYDLIGDIHGYADELEQLLEALGYQRGSWQKSRGVYSHPERKVIFLGDFIDRGPKIRQVLEIVRPMIEAGTALAVMGNHELNALAYHTPDLEDSGEFMRRHTEKNEHQHRQTLEQLLPDELSSYLEWFRTLPLWLDLDGLRVVHACWDDAAMKQIADGFAASGGITTEFLSSACRSGKPLFDAVEVILKGREADLPADISFANKDGHVRHRTRVRWYLSPEAQTYRSYALSDKIDCDLALEKSVIDAAVPYEAKAKPVFVGHYWLSAQRPALSLGSQRGMPGLQCRQRRVPVCLPLARGANAHERKF